MAAQKTTSAVTAAIDAQTKYGAGFNPNAPTPSQTNAQALASMKTGTSGAAKTGTTNTTGATSTDGAPAANPTRYGIVPPQAAPAQGQSAADQGANTAEEYYSDPNKAGGLEDEEYSKALKDSQGVIDSMNKSYDSEVEQAEKTGSQVDAATGSAIGAAGLVGSTAGGAAVEKSGAYTEGKVNDINTQRQAAVQKELENIRTASQAKASTDAANMIANRDKIKTDSTASITNMAKAGMDWQAFKTQFPSEYQHLADSVGGENQAQAIFAMNKAPASVVSSYTQGSQYIQVVKDPVTGAVSAQSFDLGITPPTGWVAQKLGTTATVLQDPNNPGNTIIYGVDPLTGQVTVSGTGTGTDIANSHDSNQTTDANAGAGYGTASTTISSKLGVDPSMPLSDVIQNVGIGPVVQAFIANEGSSPQGVNNNPGNVKFTGGAGQTDSGVKATDGGTFASYKTPEEGQQAIASIIQNAADGKSSSYGANPTLGSFAGTYTNTAPKGGAGGGLPTQEYGLLANVPDFNPTKAGVDQTAFNYLKEMLSQGKTPTPSSIGISTRTGSGAVFNQVAQRAADLYYKATGQALPDTTMLAANKKLLGGNNSILNNLNLQEKTISANSDLLLKNLNGSNLNQNAPLINGIIDSVKNSLGDVDVAAFQAQNTTIANELGSLLALKNASGTTVHDKLDSARLINKNDNADQIAAKVKILMKEAENGRRSIQAANAALYEQTDPLGLNPNNPVTQPGYKEATAAGLTPNYDGTYTAPNGTTWKADADGNPIQVK